METVRVRILETNLRPVRMDSFLTYRTGRLGNDFLVGRYLIRPANPSIDVRLALLPQVKRTRTGIAGNHNPACPELALDGHAVTVHISSLLIILRDTSRQAASLKEI